MGLRRGFVLHLFVLPDAGFHRESIHQPVILFHSYVTSLIWSVWPLKPAICQSYCKEAEPYSFEDQSFEPVFSYAAEKEQGSFFQWIQAVSQSNQCSQRIHSFAKISPAAGQDHASDSTCFPKHAGSPTGSLSVFSRRLYR